MLKCCGNYQKWPFSTIFPCLDVVATILATVTRHPVVRLAPLLVGMKLGLHLGRSEHLFYAEMLRELSKMAIFHHFS